jgi:hypothetical protein
VELRFTSQGAISVMVNVSREAVPAGAKLAIHPRSVENIVANSRDHRPRRPEHTLRDPVRKGGPVSRYS